MSRAPNFLHTMHARNEMSDVETRYDEPSDHARRVDGQAVTR